jgi:hypothetical protein
MKYEEYANSQVGKQIAKNCIYFCLAPKKETCQVDYDDKACCLINGKQCLRFNEPYGEKHEQNFRKKMMQV